ncbi:MAG: hypothetical protein MPW14_23900 [Candidatus Manganitrophus sp.]|nr:MAG: hypothetical protein MPW14_23900 [Candidatus Manganitrophus sp.]
MINYEISKTVSRIIEPFGTIKKLSVAALVDGTYEAAEGDTPRKYLPRNAEEMAKLEELVKKAMGFSAERQDQVEVVNVPLNPTPSWMKKPPSRSRPETRSPSGFPSSATGSAWSSG